MSRTHCEFYKRYCEYQTIVKYYCQVSLVHSIIARCLLHANQAAKSSIIALRDLTWNCKILKVICEKVEISIVANIYMITCAIHHCMVWDMLVIGLFRDANGSYFIVFVWSINCCYYEIFVSSSQVFLCLYLPFGDAVINVLHIDGLD